MSFAANFLFDRVSILGRQMGVKDISRKIFDPFGGLLLGESRDSRCNSGGKILSFLLHFWHLFLMRKLG
jgi:hypothetical protein